MPEPEPVSPRRGRPPKIDDEQIAQAVLAEGFTGLTVPAVAARLGVTPVTLYRRAATRAELLSLAWNHVLAAAEWPPVAGHWRDVLHRHALALWGLLAEHPGSVTELDAAVMPTGMVELYDDLAVALTAQGFSPAEAVLAVDSVIDLTVDHRRGVESLARRVEGAATSIAEQLNVLWSPDPEDSTGHHAVRAAMRHAITMPPRQWFTQKLELVLDGLDARLRNSNPPRDAAERNHPQ